MTLNMKSGDTWPRLTEKASENLAGATIRFIMYKADAVLNFSQVQNRVATIVGDPAEGKVEYAWKPADTINTGRYFCVFRITFRDGRIMSLPNVGYMEVRITE